MRILLFVVSPAISFNQFSVSCLVAADEYLQEHQLHGWLCLGTQGWQLGRLIRENIFNSTCPGLGKARLLEKFGQGGLHRAKDWENKNLAGWRELKDRGEWGRGEVRS